MLDALDDRLVAVILHQTDRQILPDFLWRCRHCGVEPAHNFAPDGRASEHPSKPADESQLGFPTVRPRLVEKSTKCRKIQWGNLRYRRGQTPLLRDEFGGVALLR